jgi:hypothetical protein
MRFDSGIIAFSIISLSSLFRLQDSGMFNWLRARARATGRAFEKLSTDSSMDQLLLSFSSCSGVRHKGHFPSLDKARRIQIEQKVCEHVVIIGVLKKSLQTWQRMAASTAAKSASGVASQSVESETSSTGI